MANMDQWWWSFYSWEGLRTERFYCWGFAGAAFVIMITVRQAISLQAPGSIVQVIVLTTVYELKVSNTVTMTLVSIGYKFFLSVRDRVFSCYKEPHQYWYSDIVG